MKHKTKRIILLILFFALVVLAVFTLWGNTALEVNELTVKSTKIPESFNGFRIAHVSDLHNAQIGQNNSRLLSALRDSAPEIIVITGDLVDSRRTDTAVALDFAKEAVKIAPVYYVTGNHEARIADSLAGFEKDLAAFGVKILHNETATLTNGSESVRLIGLDDPTFTPYLTHAETVDAQLASLCSPEYYTVLLSHRPELFETYVKHEVDLVFSGHAHGGQFRLPFIGGVFAPGQGLFPEYDCGTFKKDETVMAVSRGIGNSIFPLRFNNRPEIIITELVRSE